MQCPQCNQKGKPNKIGDVTINECLTCRGMWFDRGELDEVKDELVPDMGWLKIDTWRNQADLIARGSERLCPKCRNTMLTVIKDQQSQTEIDRCTRCKGTWLAAGQFLLLINTLLDEANQKTAPEFVKIRLKKVKDMVTSSDSTLSDWQDLKTVLVLLKHRIFTEHPKLKSIVEGDAKIAASMTCIMLKTS